MRTNTQGQQLKSDNIIKGRYSDIEGYIFDIIQRALKNSIRTIKELERYLGLNYSDVLQ